MTEEKNAVQKPHNIIMNDRKTLSLSVSVLFSLALYALCIMSLARGGFNPFIYFQF